MQGASFTTMKQDRLPRTVAMALSGVLVAMSAGCPIVETPSPEPRGMVVYVYDSISGELIDGAEVIAESGEYKTWLLDAGPELPWWYVGVYRPGVFRVTVRADGYQDNVTEGWRVEAKTSESGVYHGFQLTLVRVYMERSGS